MRHLTGTFPKPYYVVIFMSQKAVDDPAFDEMQRRIAGKVTEAEGFLGMDRYRSPEGLGFSISYWETLDNVKAWRDDETHMLGQRQAREKWYSEYSIRTCLVLDDNVFPTGSEE